MIERKKGGRKRQLKITNDEWYIYLSMKNVRRFYSHAKYKTLLSKYLNLRSFLPELVEKLIKRSYKKSPYAIKIYKLRLVQNLVNGKLSNERFGLTCVIKQFYTGKKKDKLHLKSCKIIWCGGKQGNTIYVLRKFDCSLSKFLTTAEWMCIDNNYENGNDIGLFIIARDNKKCSLLAKFLFTSTNEGKTKQRNFIINANDGNYGDFNARSFCRKQANYPSSMERNNSSVIHFETKKGRSLKIIYGKNAILFETKKGRSLKITYGKNKMYKLWERKISLGNGVRPDFDNIKGTFYEEVIINIVGNNYRTGVQENNYLKSFSIISIEEVQQYRQFKRLYTAGRIGRTYLSMAYRIYIKRMNNRIRKLEFKDVCKNHFQDYVGYNYLLIMVISTRAILTVIEATKHNKSPRFLDMSRLSKAERSKARRLREPRRTLEIYINTKMARISSQKSKDSYIHNYANVVISTRDAFAVITAIKVIQPTGSPKLSRLSKAGQNTKGRPRENYNSAKSTHLGSQKPEANYTPNYDNVEISTRDVFAVITLSRDNPDAVFFCVMLMVAETENKSDGKPMLGETKLEATVKTRQHTRPYGISRYRNREIDDSNNADKKAERGENILVFKTVGQYRKLDKQVIRHAKQDKKGNYYSRSK